MNEPNPARVPAGVSTGGQFARTARVESPLRLVPEPFRLADGEEPVNGLVARENRRGTYMLVDAATGRPALHGAERGRRGAHPTPEAALEWAAVTYPLVQRVASTVARAHPVLVPKCGDCQVDMVQELDDEKDRPTPIWTCPICGDTPR
ncbi:hypothetical protein [Cellulosimicrobium sp. Marseille-Q4280]|uniref:hypothetical protein n=1 Tax=Cellulosimicrobium sp. Marseille-Q4280 TaxID=2937992 RepID=UPI0020424820|nr:hypothetical protein [Cellulosimicrobium sp. Marseille-Q4280]